MPQLADSSTLSNGLPIVDGAYRTPSRPVSALARWFPGSIFYPQLVYNIFRASAQAKRGEYGDQAWIDTSAAILRKLEEVGLRFDVTGLNYLAQLETPCLVVANHMSTLETAVLPSLIRPLRAVTFVVKQSLIDYPVFKHVMRARRPIAVTQTNPRLDLKTMLADGAERLSEGTSIVVFPEGIRTPAFDPARFNTIGVKLAQRSEVPIVPLALSTGAWGLGKGMFKDFGKLDAAKPVHFAFGEPLRVRGRGVEENAAIIDFIQQHLRRWEAEGS